MIESAVWVEEARVRSSDTDFSKHWKISGYFRALQEAAANHASHLGFDYRAMLAKEMVWILSRIKVRFIQPPDLGETVSIRTWPKGLQQKLFFMRDFELTGAGGRPVAQATSAWLLVNTRARRILPPQALGGTVPDNGGRSALDEPLEKIGAVADPAACYTVQAGYSAVDLMEHVNNAQYVDWVCDCFSIAEHQAHPLAWLQVNYINEVKPGEAVTLYRGCRPDQPLVWYVTGVNAATGARSFEAEAGWQ